MIRFNNLDQGYDQCTNLYTYVKNNGEKLATNLSQNIVNLINHWQGEDATLHINGLVKVYNGLTEFVSSALTDTAYAIDRIVEVQEVRHANGSSGNVGTRMPKNATSFETKTEINSTAEYNCDPAANDDHHQLVQICSEFEAFASTVVRDANDLMQNWLDGNERDRVKNNFEEFATNSETFKKILFETRDALGVAVSNISTIM